jgi:LysR family hydrogen peroxide-inducible transcriptional activator
MEMHQLRYFVAAARAGTFSRAAVRCHVAQPSLSQQIHKLESRLGQRLFHRLGRRVVLTDAGRALLDHAERIVSTAEEVERRLRSGEEIGGGRLAIGVIPTVAPYLLPRPLQAFARRWPDSELVVREDVTANLVQALADGELDFAIAAAPIADNRLTTEVLGSEPLLAALPPRHPLARRPRLTIQQLAQERFILLNEVHCLGDQILSFCRINECQPFIACRSAQIGTVQALIALNQGVSLLPEMARRADRSGAVVYRRLAPEEPRRTLAVFRHRHRVATSPADRFLATLKRHTASWRQPPAALD